MKTYTTGEIAQFCDVNLRTVIRWIDRGKLKGFKLPGRGNNRVLEKDLLYFLQQHSIPLPAPLMRSSEPTLLIIDDSRDAQSLQRVARKVGFHAVIATSALEAGLLLPTLKPSVICVDIRMPGLQGDNAVDVFRDFLDAMPAKIVVVSSSSESQLKKARQKGADAVFCKPVSPADIAGVLEEYLTPAGIAV